MTLGENFLIGIDAGGTKSRGVLVEVKSLSEMARAEGGPANPFQVGVDESVRVILEIIQHLRYKAAELNGRIESICVGMAGAGRERDVEDLKRHVEAEFVTDAEAALVGGLMREWGAVLICGTGSIALAISPSGERFRAGGWGAWLGDEGSGFDIAIRSLRTVMRSHDGRCERTILSDMILRELGLKGEEELIYWISSAKRDEVAMLAKLTFKAADEGDKIASLILDEAAEELALLAESVLNRLEKPDLILLTGGVFEGQPLFRAKVSQLISRRVKGVRCVRPIKGPEFGAALIGLKRKKRQI